MLGDYKFFTFTVVLIAAEQVLVFLLKVLRVLLNRLALNIKGLNLNSLEKGTFCRAVIVRTKLPTPRLDGSVLYFSHNNALIIKKKQDLKSKYVFGPVSSTIRRKKFKTIFKTIL